MYEIFKIHVPKVKFEQKQADNYFGNVSSRLQEDILPWEGLAALAE